MPSPCPPDALLDQFLAEQLSPSSEDELEQHLRACDGCRDRLERIASDGEATPRLGIATYPPLSAEFAQRLEDSLRGSCATESSDWDVPLPEIPGYEVVEIIGRGGSSVIFRAIDQKLQRTVAIKVLRARANSADRERFAREAKALAALRHPNITRAHSVGESNEHPHLVMEFVAGGSLGRFTAGQPQDALPTARFVRLVADAMQAAHSAGFVHRDLKPSNILLEARLGTTEVAGLDRFVPKVTDLGIVKDLNRDDGFTKTRDCLGTPSYMAPEQVQGSNQPVDGRTDVYAVGVVLYELLTGRPPFRAGSPLDTMLLVKHEDPVTPSRFQPRIPRDLETICLKCLEKDPARRYQSAQQLADDLDRFLSKKPILARRTGWPGKLWRWTRRNPGWAAAAAIGVLLLLAFAIGGPLVANRERRLRAQALEHERIALEERARARSQFDLASRALEGTLDQVLRSARLQEDALDDVRASLIRGALPYYEQYLQSNDGDVSVRLRQSRMLLHTASINAKENKPGPARADYRRALEMLESIAKESASPDREVQLSLASAHQEWGRFLQVSDSNAAAAEPHYRRSLALRLELLQADPAATGLRDSAAIAWSLLGTLLRDKPGHATEAEASLKQACEIRDRLVADFPARNDLRHYAALAHFNLGMLYQVQNNLKHEIEQFRIGLDQERLVNQSLSASLEAPFFLSLLEGELGIAFGRNGQNELAVRHLTAASQISESLKRLYPSVPKYAELNEQWQEALEYVKKQR